jgi:hypothetical protein
VAYDETAHSAFHNEVVSLTTANIYRWMADAGHFPRRAIGKQDSNRSQHAKMAALFPSADQLSEMYCSHCGLDYLHHTSHTKMESEESSVCDMVPSSVTQLPIMDPSHFFSNLDPGIPMAPYMVQNSLWHSAKNLIAVSDPTLTLAIRASVSQLRLKTFGYSNRFLSTPSGRSFPLTELGVSASEIDNHIAPYALLSIVIRSFIRALVRGGLIIADQDGFGKRSTRLLTPSHILRGLYTQRELCRSLLPSIVPIGIPFTGNIGSVGVKMEEEEL